ncbi:MAG: low specificity L-threonine aldolase [Firmicutes bacterium]|nr:low specificity L-threonine aldolase [Bacillota bacterium]
MILFQCDYNEGAHEKILERLIQTNMEQTDGYGMDPYCASAARKIKERCQVPEADVHFLVGGTQTNVTVISAILKPWQGVISASSGHIHVHETGAVEACGHKVLAIPSEDGKITGAQVEALYQGHIHDESAEHTVQPGMVYISNPTELGTIYSLAELTDLSQACRRNGLILFMDGARLGYGLTAKGNDLTFESIAKLCDVFYIGGTKVGALFGEAVVITNPSIQKDFRYMIKQKGGMLAKGRLLGIQFDTLFTDDLYLTIAAQANCLADHLREAFAEAGYPFLIETTTNQIFVIMPDDQLAELKKNYGFCYQQRMDETHSAVRFCTSWATKSENVTKLIEDVCNLKA